MIRDFQIHWEKGEDQKKRLLPKNSIPQKLSEEQKHEVVVVAEVHLVDQLAGRIGKVMQIVMPASKDMPPDTDS